MFIKVWFLRRSSWPNWIHFLLQQLPAQLVLMFCQLLQTGFDFSLVSDDGTFHLELNGPHVSFRYIPGINRGRKSVSHGRVQLANSRWSDLLLFEDEERLLMFRINQVDSQRSLQLLAGFALGLYIWVTANVFVLGKNIYICVSIID